MLAISSSTAPPQRIILWGKKETNSSKLETLIIFKQKRVLHIGRAGLWYSGNALAPWEVVLVLERTQENTAKKGLVNHLCQVTTQFKIQPSKKNNHSSKASPDGPNSLRRRSLRSPDIAGVYSLRSRLSAANQLLRLSANQNRTVPSNP